MAYNNHTYVILNKSEIVDGNGVELIDFSQLLNRGSSMLRYSLDGNKTFVKYDGDQPDFLAGKEELNHEQMLALYESDWRNE